LLSLLQTLPQDFLNCEDSLMKRVLSVCVLFVVVILFVSPTAWAGTTGKISGKVLDAAGDAVVGASVQIIETSRGAACDVDGNFVILGVVPGTYTVRITNVGYGIKTYKGVVVEGDNTTTLDVTLQEEAINLGPVDVEFQQPTVNLNVTGKQKRIDRTQMETQAVKDVSSLLAKQPGFKVDPAGEMHVRGGRAADMLVKVDGVDFRDPLVGGSKQLVNFSALNVEEIEVMTGGDARYGGFQAALVNVTTPEGSMTDYNGVLEWRTDQMFKRADPYKAFSNAAHKLTESSFNSDQWDYSISGPVPFADRWLGKQKLSFFSSGTARLDNTYTPYNINRPNADLLGIGFKIPQRQNNDYSTFWKFTYLLDKTKKFNFTFQRDFSQWDVYPGGEASIDGNYGWQYKYDVANRPFIKNSRQSVSLQFTHNLSKSTLYEISVSNFTTATEIQPRGKNPGDFTLSTLAEDDNRRFIGSVDQNKDGFPDGFVDANGDGVYDGSGEGYDDRNANGKWDRGEDWVDLNGNGVYDPAEPWTDVTDPVTGRNNVGVKDPWDPYVDLNHNGRWDPAEPQLAEQDWNHNGVWDGEPFQDANRNGRYDGFGEGYDDKNLNGSMDRRELFDASKEVTGEPFIDGDYWNDTGEPFIDLPDSSGNYDGIHEDGEPWFDLPTTYLGPTAGRGTVPTTNGVYDGPNGAFDEYELFTYPATLGFGMDPRFPVLYTFGDITNGMRDATGRYTALDWLRIPPLPNGRPGYSAWIPGKSTWTNATLSDQVNPVFDPPNGIWDSGKPRFAGDPQPPSRESFRDYNGNGVDDPRPDYFLNPGTWDATAFWMHRQASEWSTKFDLTSQINKFHELKTGMDLKYRILNMSSISNPDQPYTNSNVPLPAGSPYPDRGGVRDFYQHKPWEGALYVQDKMEFEGMIVRAGLRTDFILQDPQMREETQKQLDATQPGALLANRGRFALAPRLGISHPISSKAKLYFNYGHYYQTPSFSYFYQSATANLSPNTQIGNPNLQYEKTVSYEVGVNTEFTEDWVLDVAGYYRDVFNQIGTVSEKDGPLTLNRYFNLGYARARGFEFSLEKKFSSMWAVTFNYDYSYAYGKESAATDGLTQRVTGVPENRDEYPLTWDQTHSISAFLTLMVSERDKVEPFGVKLPNNWLSTVQFSYGSGYPYTPSTYVTGLPSNLILPNSARMPNTVNLDLKFDKFWNLTKKMKLATGFEIYNLLDRRNVRSLYSETGNNYQSLHPDDPNWTPGRQDADMNPRNFGAPRQILLHFKITA
jgi:outer membrane receptor protein involved in Fe transport